MSKKDIVNVLLGTLVILLTYVVMRLTYPFSAFAVAWFLGYYFIEKRMKAG